MNSFVKVLIQPILEAEGQKGIALVPGGFKPPTVGHFALVDEVAKNPNFEKVIVLIGHKNRDGVSKEESKEIWDIYKKYLPSNVEIKTAENSSPISDVASMIKNNPDTFFYPVVGIRGEMDLGDLKRFDSLEGKYPNFKTIVIRSESSDDRVSGTNTRAALIGGEKERFQSYLPAQLSQEEKDKVWSILTKTPLDEVKYAEPSEHDYPKLIKSLTEFMLDKGMNLRPLPKVKFVNDDIENARDFFGKTAYYDPNNRVIVLYTMDRHPKDIMRSYAHEMIHHMQNCDNRLGNITTQNTNEEGDLPEIEREAYEKGNMMFRGWTDTITEGVIKEEDDSDALSYPSTFKPGVNILVVFKENENYPNLKPYFDEYGYGFYYPKDKTIIIDGERFVNSDLDFNDLKFVEAHEVTHLLLGHTGPYSEDDEMDADLGAYILLTNKGLPTDKLVKEFKNRHGVDFSEELLERVKNLL
jgi:phosphopantetheine adenylyltransferase/Zn-dependent peptidase ImmA (M78 family)